MTPARIVRVSHDHQALRTLHRETFPGDLHPAWSCGWWWLALRDGEPVAFAGVQPSARWADAVYLARCGVTEAARGQGLQRRLLRTRERFARGLGMRWAITSTLHNPASANNLADAGYRMYEPAAPWGVRGTLYWKKEL